MTTSKAPRKREVALESDIINLITERLYPQDFAASGSSKSNAKKRVRSTVRYARTTSRLEPPVTKSPPKIHLARFFQWAVQQWPQLVDIQSALPDEHVIVKSPPTLSGATGSVRTQVVPSDPKTLKQAYQALLERLDILEADNERLRLFEERTRSRSAQASRDGKKGGRPKKT